MLNRNLNVRALLEAHDTIAQEDFENEENLLDLLIKRQNGELSEDNVDAETSPLPYYASPPVDAIRMIGIRKLNDEPLGIYLFIDKLSSNFGAVKNLKENKID